MNTNLRRKGEGDYQQRQLLEKGKQSKKRNERMQKKTMTEKITW